MKSNPFFRVLFTLLALMGLLYVVTKVFALMNKASDIAVATGVTILIIAVWLLYFFLHWLWKKKATVSKEVKNVALVMMLSIFAVSASGCNGCGCQIVEPGHVGITMNMNGDNRGVEQIPTENGWVLFNPITQKVYVYPIFVQTAVWTRDSKEGSPNNEEISFNTNDGSVVTCDISLSYALDPNKVPAFYVKFRSDDLRTFTHGFLRNVTRDAFNETATHYKVEDIYGEKKEEFLVTVRERVNKFMEPYGVKLEQLGTIGPMRIPQIVLDALNLKLAAMQTAMRIENEVRQREAEAKKMQVDAEAYAKKIKTEAEANAEANRMMNNSITPLLIQWEIVKRWNGQNPYVVGGGNTMMIQVPKF